MSPTRSFIVIGLTLASQAPTAFAETVILKNGTALHGSIVQMDDVNLIIETADLGQVTVKRRTIQSIQDGAPLAPAAPPTATPAAAAAAATSQNVNVNTNVLPNQNQQQVDPKPSVLPTSSPAPGVRSDDDNATFVGGHIAYGLSSVAMGRSPTFNKTSPSLAITLLGYRSPSSLYVDLQGEATQNKQDYNQTSWARVSMGLGYASKPPALNQSGGMFEVMATLGYGQMESKFTDYDWSEGSYNYRMTTQTLTSAGPAYGFALGYSYFFTNAIGVHLGTSYTQNQITETKYNGHTVHSEIDRDEVSVVSANVGLAYRF